MKRHYICLLNALLSLVLFFWDGDPFSFWRCPVLINRSFHLGKKELMMYKKFSLYNKIC